MCGAMPGRIDEPLSSPFEPAGNYLALLSERIKVVRPRLHHLASLRQILRVVVGRLHLIPFGMRELPLDDQTGPAQLMQTR